MTNKLGYSGIRGVLLVCSALTALPASGTELSTEKIIQNCYYKYAGDDQRSKMTITLQSDGGTPNKSEYLRLWKNYDGQDDLVDKVVLFTTSPPHNKGLAFMRWGYTYASQKQPDQWIYLPDLRKVRRIAPRDPETKDWVIKDEDLRIRELAEDKHQYLGVQKDAKGKQYHTIAFTPKADPVYGKRVFWFTKTDHWENCIHTQTDFYDKDDHMIKQQLIDWKKIDDAWTWSKVFIKSTMKKSYIRYDIRDVEVNVGLDDSVFSRSTMSHGYRK